MSGSELHPSVVALVALSAHLASGHPDRGLCQLDKLKQYGVTDAQIDEVVDIARHIRDEAGQKLDASFDEARVGKAPKPTANAKLAAVPIAETACCTPTAGGKPCC
jgi:hypothetical protein